jgi:nitrous oxide reductase accessory protein NosL
VQLASISNLVERLSASESKIPELRSEVQKRIVWFNKPEEKTEISVVYVHGFSATLQELRPFPDNVASGLKANLFLHV